MKIKSLKLKSFKRFVDLTIDEIPQSAKLVILTGPNGCGKSSLFEAFNFWSKHKTGHGNYDVSYHSRNEVNDHGSMVNDLEIKFHDFEPASKTENNRRCFYIRSAYRHEADFTSGGISNVEDILNSPKKLNNLISQEARVSENYNRIVGEAVEELFNGADPDKTKIQIRDKLIGEVRSTMLNLFDGLNLSGTGNPTSGGTFRFEKGSVLNFHFKNLSGGEKAAFDLILDFIVKKEAFSETVFCIDEPELHMHTKLQARLLEEIYNLTPENCQLWISTHSIGMARKAAEINIENPGRVAFIDFHDQDFDQAANLNPVTPNRKFWKSMFSTALDDLAELVVPINVIFCEGKKLGDGGRKPSFDTSVYSIIFQDTHADTDFIPLGGTSDIQRDAAVIGPLLRKLAPGIKTWAVYDRDDRHETEIAELRERHIRVLNKRDLESYLWDDEILDKLATVNNQPQKAEILKAKKSELLEQYKVAGKPTDDIKAISGQLYNFCKVELGLNQCGNNFESFARCSLAQLVTPDTDVYKDLNQIIFGN